MSQAPAPEVVPAGVPGRTKPERVRAMFGRIVARYDAMNRLMTLGMDRSWRREAARLAAPEDQLVLDVGTGTGDLALAMLAAGARHVVGLDFVDGMLAVAAGKARLAGRDASLALIEADALHLPFPDETFDRVVNGFVLRNVGDLDAALREMRRVLKPGGRLVCLEVTHPPRLAGPLGRLYFAGLVPVLGGLVTGEAAAYRYLPASLGPLPDAPALASRLRASGFADVAYRRLGFGMVAIHVGCRYGSPGDPVGTGHVDRPL